ncbi:hypothetical protein BKA24_002106 [Microbacterium marinum]|uniref:SPOR domain-containing protein n=1 Tax=Microbacterium marinum TaxID=421115 RepID=A0A7W7BRB0_9MICO|nr:SPOR domain-containing protein [Microbacterium marinum]MBB4667397.1 hypothetical protein [Microbacterium marinum]
MSDTEQYWFNLTTKKVERGFESPAVDRAGPFATEEEAARAPELLAERSRAWAADEAEEDRWGTPAAGDSADASDR